MKIKLLRVYYDLLIKMEDFFDFFSTKINEHRKRIDEEHWDEIRGN